MLVVRGGGEMATQAYACSILGLSRLNCDDTYARDRMGQNNSFSFLFIDIYIIHIIYLFRHVCSRRFCFVT